MLVKHKGYRSKMMFIRKNCICNNKTEAFCIKMTNLTSFSVALETCAILISIFMERKGNGKCCHFEANYCHFFISEVKFMMSAFINGSIPPSRVYGFMGSKSFLLNWGKKYQY